jgi:hypothetical protein
MSDNKTPKTDDIATHLTALGEMRSGVDRITTNIESLLQKQHAAIKRLEDELGVTRLAHEKTEAELAATAQELSGVRQDAANLQKRFREAEAKIKGAPKAVAEEWLEELGKSQLIGGLDRVIRGEAESDPADFRKQLVTWFGRRVNTKPEEVIAVGQQLVEKDSKAAAQIEWSPDTPFRDDVDAVEVEITYSGLRFGEIVIERARGNVVEVITQLTKDAVSAAVIEAEASPLSPVEAAAAQSPTAGEQHASTNAVEIAASVTSIEPVADSVPEQLTLSESSGHVFEDAQSSSAGMIASADKLEEQAQSTLTDMESLAQVTEQREIVENVRTSSTHLKSRKEFESMYQKCCAALDKTKREQDDAEVIKAFVGYLFGKESKSHRALLEKHPADRWHVVLAKIQTNQPEIRIHLMKACEGPAAKHLASHWPENPDAIEPFSID